MTATVQALYIGKGNKNIPTRGVRALLDEINHLKTQLSHHQNMIELLEKQSVQDSLTGLINRRGFDQALDKSFATYQRYNRNSALLMIDVNNFKPINDTFGHQVGDAALIHIAKLLTTHTRKTDTVARIGGDEFCIILTEIEKSQAIAKQKKLEEIIQTIPYLYKNKEIFLSASIGFSMFDEALNQEDVIEKADMQMYQNKQSFHKYK